MRVPAVTSAQRRERAKIAAWARERTADSTTIFLDTETTGLGREAEIIDLGVVDIHGNVLIDTLIAPRSPIPPETTRVHGIVDADVVGAPNWMDVYPILAALLRERPVVVYNADFDRRMIAGCCTSFGIEGETAEWHCAMRQYAAWAGVRSSHKRQRYRLHKLGDALAEFDLPPGNHRALADAVACRSLVLALAASDF
jgi:DNA polymerase III epsilon subunit-like protein